MAIVDEQASTHITGAPVNPGKGAHPGEVLAERYEIVEELGRDAYVIDHRAIDQETDEPCILRIVEQELLVGTKAKVVARKVRGAVGIGSRFLPGIKDVDVDEVGRLFIIEPPPAGTRLREVLGSRTSRGGAFKAHEVLPVLARLAAAIEAIPGPYHHGDVRLDRVWLAEDGLSLTVPFVLAALPPTAIAGRAQGHDVLSRCLAPELSRGLVGGASDRFGVGCIAHELLTGEPPPAARGSFPLLSPWGEVGEIIGRYLCENPKDRPSSLRPLIEAIAKSAGLPIPNLEAGAYRKPNRARGEMTSGLLLPPDEIVEPMPMGVRRRNRRSLVTDTIEETAGDLADQTANMSAVEAVLALGGAKEADDYDDAAFTRKASPLSRGEIGLQTAKDMPRVDRALVPAPLPKEPSEPSKTHERGKLPEDAAAEGTQEILTEDLEAVAQDSKREGEASKKSADPLRSTISDDAPPVHHDNAPPGAQAEGTQQIRAEDILEVATPTSGDAQRDGGQKEPSRKANEKLSSTPTPEDTQELQPEDILGAELANHELAASTAAEAPAASPTAGSPRAADPSLQEQTDALEAKAEAPTEAAPSPALTPSTSPTPPAPPAHSSAPPPAHSSAPPPVHSSAPAPAHSSALPPSTPPMLSPDEAPATMAGGDYDAEGQSSMSATAVAGYRPRTSAERRSRVGRWIVVGAVALAALIILSGVLIASQRRAEAERERHLQQRFLELQQQSASPN